MGTGYYESARVCAISYVCECYHVFTNPVDTPRSTKEAAYLGDGSGPREK